MKPRNVSRKYPGRLLRPSLPATKTTFRVMAGTVAKGSAAAAQRKGLVGPLPLSRCTQAEFFVFHPRLPTAITDVQPARTQLSLWAQRHATNTTQPAKRKVDRERQPKWRMAKQPGALALEMAEEGVSIRRAEPAG
jgi:hypothetical protein